MQTMMGLYDVAERAAMDMLPTRLKGDEFAALRNFEVVVRGEATAPYCGGRVHAP